MASLSVRKLDDATMQRLRVRAASRGVSMEEEARRILQQAVGGPDQLGKLALEVFGPAHGVDVPETPRQAHDPIDFGD